jgi:hypothetical protein
MASIVDETGERVEAEGAVELSADVIELARTIAAVRLRRRKVSLRRTAQFLGLPTTSLRRRLARLTPEMRAIYEHTPLDSLGL